MPYKTMNGKLFYRVGDVIISTNNENPSKWYGGTWELFAPGKTMVCIDTSQSEFNTIKKTGGEKVHTLSLTEMPSHNHGGTANSAGEHIHPFINHDNGGGTGTNYVGAVANRPTGFNYDRVRSGGVHSHSLSINNTGSSNAHNNLQPFIVVYMWIRTS